MYYRVINVEGVWYRPLTTALAEKLAKKGGEVYRYDHLKLNRLFPDSVFAPNDLYYYAPLPEEKTPRWTGDTPLVCPNCGHDAFYARQVCRIEVIVDGSGEFLDNISDKVEEHITDAETPYGPFTCTECEYEFDTE